MKIAILILILLVFSFGCQKAVVDEPITEETEEIPVSEVDEIEEDLDISELDNLEEDLGDIEW